jgi:RNA polymerase sigma factor (sigma-70 family)
MNKRDSNRENDLLLLPFLQATDEAEAQSHLNQLVARVAPLVEKITNRNSHEDDFQEAIGQVIKALRDCKDDPVGKAIHNFEHYVSVVAANVRRKRIRDQHPEHQALKDSLRNALKREPRLALWDGQNRETVCGLAAWRGRDSAGSQRLTQLLDQPLACEDAVLPGRDAQRLENTELLAAIFAWLGHPVAFDDLVRIVFDLKRIVEFTQVSDSGEEEAHPPNGPSPYEEVRWTEFLEKLWAEIEQLKPQQRLAYLLNFTDANGRLDLFVIYGVATIRRIGATLQLSDEQFARLWPELKLSDEARHRAEALKSYDEKFALLWRRLPLEDKVIAQMLDTNRQRVINQRKKAHGRLARRLAPLHQWL